MRFLKRVYYKGIISEYRLTFFIQLTKAILQEGE